MSMQTYSDELKQELLQLIKSTKDLCAIIITDKDGIPIIKAYSESVSETFKRPNFLAATAITIDQASKLGAGQCRRVSFLFENYKLIQFNNQQIIITLVGTEDCNTGLLYSLENRFTNIVNDLKKAIK